MKLDKSKLGSRFGAAAAGYDDEAHIQEQAAETLARMLSAESLKPRRILDIGCGTGLLTRKLFDRFPEAEILAVDLAPGMAKEAARRFAGNARVKVVAGDIEKTFPDGPFDLIASSMAFQWLENPDSVMREVSKNLTPDGSFAMIAPGGETFRELRGAYTRAAKELGVVDWRYPGPDFYPAALWKSWAEEAFGEEDTGAVTIVEPYDSARALLDSVRAIGAADATGGAGPSAVPLLRRALKLYDGGSTLGVQATWELVVVRGRAKARRGIPA